MPDHMKYPESIPMDVGVIHFVGIGGIGMSGIAEILHNLGYNVQGSDISQNANSERLTQMGITVQIGQCASNVENAAVVVRSSAVSDENPEILEARKRSIPVIRRADMLAELMRLKYSVAIAGTHGKTTTTSLVASLFEAQKFDPTVINGGIINAYGTNARLGDSKWLVAEADESDGSFLNLPATVAVVTNIDPEHMEFYGSFENLFNAFKQFVETVPFYGFAVLCKDHPEVERLIDLVYDRKVISYGITTDADVKATSIKTLDDGSGSVFDVTISERVKTEVRHIPSISLAMPGEHNVLNALSAIAVALELGFDINHIMEGLGGFQGVKRRFTHTGEVDGVLIIDDYGHHPKEIAVTLKTAKSVAHKRGGKVIAVVQPHRYSRVHDLYDDFASCFGDADVVIVTDIYEAGEVPIEGVNRDALVERISQTGHPLVESLPCKEKLPHMVLKHASSGDVVVCLGAGSISLWANELPSRLQELSKELG